MTNATLPSTWLAEETAHIYKDFTNHTTMYQDLSHTMVDVAGIKPGMTVLDLGCGTGITSQVTLEAMQGQGHIIALDISEPMLTHARALLPTNTVTFLQADAVSFASLLTEITTQPIDRVICNSVFWQFRDKPKVLAELHQIMAANGRFVFNAPEPYLIFKSIPRSKRVSILFRQLAAEKYGVGTQDMRTIRVFLKNHGFSLVKTQLYERTRSTDESYRFMQLPVSTAWMEPPLDYETRMQLLAEAHELAESNEPAVRRWMYFACEKVN